MKVPTKATQQKASTEVDHRLVELQSLFEMSQVLNSSLQLRTILNNLLLTPMGRMMISRGLVMVADEKGAFSVEVLKGLPREILDKKIYVEYELKKPTQLSDISRDDCRWKTFFEKLGIDLLLPIVSTQRMVGIMGLGRKIGMLPFSSAEIEFLNLLSNIAATAIENSLMFHRLESVNRQLDKKVQELNTLFEIGQELNSTLDTEKIVNLLIFAIMGELVVNRCFVLLKEDKHFKIVSHKGTRNESADLEALSGKGFLKSIGHIENPMLVGKSELSRNLRVLERLNLSVIAPMRVQDETKGVIILGEKITKQGFSPEDLDFITTLGNLAMTCLENARLFEETLEKQKMEEELAIAREIQQRLLPRSYPAIDGFDIHGLNLPSRQVGGDYFDCIQIDEEHLAITIADVSGKGIPASLLMSNLQAGLHSLITPHADIAAMVSKLNNLIYAHTTYDKFITFFYAELDIKEKTLTYVNAGHNPPYLCHSNASLQPLECGGLVLGMMPNVPYETEKISLRSGDLLLMFTDGVTEAVNTENKQFEEWRVEKILSRWHTQSVRELLDTITGEMAAFVKGAPQADDITMLALKAI
jgi:sigma-B regulation protein RsbU (phosphoserine phosphatase)